MRKNSMRLVNFQFAIAFFAVGLATAMSLRAQTAAFQPTVAPPEGHFAAVNGCQIYYEVYGEGRPLLLLHGFKASGQFWKPFLGEFTKQYQVIVPDLRGHGRSTNPSKQFTHRFTALDMLALLDQLKLLQVDAIGVSSGAMTLLHMATQKPGRIGSMVLVSGTTYFPEQARAIMRLSTVEKMTPTDWETARQTHKQGDEQIRMLTTQFHELKDNFDDMNFTPPYLSLIQARTLIVHGDRDPFFSVSIALDMYRAVPNAYLWIVPNGGHIPIFGDPAGFVKTSLEFLQAGQVKK